VRKHAGRQAAGWRFDFRTCMRNPDAFRATAIFAIDLRAIAARQAFGGYELT